MARTRHAAKPSRTRVPRLGVAPNRATAWDPRRQCQRQSPALSARALTVAHNAQTRNAARPAGSACRGVIREAAYEIGVDGTTWRAGHVRTRDFRTFEPNPHNPIFTPSGDPDAWECNGVLTPQIFEVNGTYYMLYAGLKGREWQTRLAVAR